MAPIVIQADSSAAPLADCFFIAGIEASSIRVQISAFNPYNSPQFNSSRPLSDSQPFLTHTSSVKQQTNATSPLFNGSRTFTKQEARKSRISFSGLESNRSSVTVRPTEDTEKLSNNTTLTDGDFDQALRKFISERDSFLEQIQFSTGELTHRDAAPPKPKIQRLSGQEHHRKHSSNVDTIRQRFSSMMSRQVSSSKPASKRLSRRVSAYNSILATPQRFRPHSDMHPLQRKYEPILVDSYPTKHLDGGNRPPLPDHVPLFVFPNDVHVVASDERPRPTWHSFVLTDAEGVRTYGTCIILWTSLPADAAEELEQQCERWRIVNMTPAERDMANDLGDRLASERARLAVLQANLSILPYGTEEREIQEEVIATIEDKIALMADALRPVRHAAASRINGLTDGDTGFWIPQAYGILGRESAFISFHKEWLRAVTVPMMGGGVLRVPSSSPRVGVWQPLEKYVVNLFEAPSPVTSITQVEISVRELRLHARKEAVNEIPGSRTTDLYPLFHCLAAEDIVTLLEYALMESRVIFLSSHAAMLHLACAALTQLLWPLKWTGVYIPVLPARMLQILDAPCPYIIGIERCYERVELPQDFMLVDLDRGTVESSTPPSRLPHQQRTKLLSILQLAAPFQNHQGMSKGPPKFVTDAFPHDGFPTENPVIFDADPPKSTLHHLATVDSSSFGATALNGTIIQQPMFNAFLGRKHVVEESGASRPTTGSTICESVPASPSISSIAGSHFHLKRQDSALALQTSLREKRSGGLGRPSYLKRNSTMTLQESNTVKATKIPEKHGTNNDHIRRPSLTLSTHTYAASISTSGRSPGSTSTYSPSIYAESTAAPSTIMPTTTPQFGNNDGGATWAEGHCLVQSNDGDITCGLCNEKGLEVMYKCSGCGMKSHSRCTDQICLPCSATFHPDQIIAAFARLMASLFGTYRKFLAPANADEQKAGAVYRFNVDGFLNSVPHEHAQYLTAIRDTQAFTAFIDTVISAPPTANAEVHLFDELIAAKRNRSRSHATSQFFSKSSSFGFGSTNSNKKKTPAFSFLADTSDHLWRNAAVRGPCSRTTSTSSYSSAVSAHSGLNSNTSCSTGRIPSKLDPTLLREPRVVHGTPRLELGMKRVRRKELPVGINAGTQPRITKALETGSGNVNSATMPGFGVGTGVGLGLKMGHIPRTRSESAVRMLR